MAEKKLDNLLKFEEFSKLHDIQKPNKKTEVGGFSVSDGEEKSSDVNMKFNKKRIV